MSMMVVTTGRAAVTGCVLLTILITGIQGFFCLQRIAQLTLKAVSMGSARDIHHQQRDSHNRNKQIPHKKAK